MEIILTVLNGQSSAEDDSADRLYFPMLPQDIKVKTGALFQEYKILKLGTVKLPLARDLTGFSWDGMLPGEIRKDAPYVHDWTDPRELQVRWSVYQRDGTKLRLLVTETPINHDVYIDSYEVTYKNGMGDYNYSINFIHAIDIKVKLSGEDDNKQGADRPNPPPSDTHTVAKGESLWSIAEKTLGGGDKYTKLYEANKELIDAANKGTGGDQYLIHPGQIIKIPKPVSDAPPKTKTKPKAAPRPK